MVDPKELVESIIAAFPDHEDDKRPIHTVGIGVQGYFVASAAARRYCIAEHLQGSKVPVTVRFSNGSGSPHKHDSWSDARGMATRFHLADGMATDLIAMTFREFFTPTPETFMAFFKAARPTPDLRLSPWEKLMQMMQLKHPPRDPPPDRPESGGQGMLNYANAHRFAQLSVFDAQYIGAPLSYARAAYHAIHTFIVTAPDGKRRYVRFTWQPVAGVAKRDPDAASDNDYLQEELGERLRHSPAEFTLQMMVGEAGDAFDDPSKPWPAKRLRVAMGTLKLTALATHQATAIEKMSFNPGRLLPGIEASDDPILKVRRDAYEVSRKMRGGTGCPFHGGGNHDN
jgi:catalase